MTNPIEDPLITEYDKQLAAIMTKRTARMMDLVDPRYQALKIKYGQLSQILQEIEAMDEALTNEEGYDLHIVGTLFRISPDEWKVEEINND